MYFIAVLASMGLHEDMDSSNSRARTAQRGINGINGIKPCLGRTARLVVGLESLIEVGESCPMILA